MQKTVADDGTVIIRKKRMASDRYLMDLTRSMDLKNDFGKIEVTLLGDETTGDISFDGETLLFYRKAGQDQVEMKSGEMDELTGGLEYYFNRIPGGEERDPCKVFFGVYVGGYGHGERGVGVSGIVSGSDWPAEVAGLQAGDRITMIDGVPVNSLDELVAERNRHEPGETFTFTILRGDEEFDVNAQFKSCPKNGEEQIVLEESLPPVQQGHSLQLQELKAYPNPTYGNLNLSFKGDAAPTHIRITDVNGRVVFEKQLSDFDGYYSEEINVRNGTPGTLMVTISQEGKMVTVPVVLLNRA